MAKAQAQWGKHKFLISSNQLNPMGDFSTSSEAKASDSKSKKKKTELETYTLTTVKALQSIGYETIASGDSYNDLGMIEASKAGFLFRSTEAIKKDHPELQAFEEYDDLLAAIKEAMAE